MILNRIRASCGKEMIVVLDNGKILSGGKYFDTIRFGIGNWSNRGKDK